MLFEGELETFLSKRAYPYGSEERYFSGGSIATAIRAMNVQSEMGLYAANKEVYEMLCSGKSLEEALPDSTKQSFDIDFIDFENPENNIFQVTDEFEVERSNGNFARPDIVVLINGIPIVVIECKKSSVDVMDGVTQNIRNWGNDYIPQLFQYAQLVMALNPDKVLYGTCGTAAKYFVSWHEDDKDWLNDWCKKCSPDGQIKEQDRSLVSLLHPERLLDLIKNFIIYDNNVKKIARYKQFFAIRKCMDRIYLKDGKETRNGVVWHTQGSGKTITMIMLTKMILKESMKKDSLIRNPRFIMVTDRIRRDHLFFKKLKDSASLRFNDSVDFSKYEDGIRQLLNTYVNAEDAKIIIEPLDILNKDKMEEQLARLGSKEAKAEAIQTRQVEVLENRRYDDPILYMTFMERINKTISDYMAERNSEKYLSELERMAEDYREGRSSIVYPEIIVDDSAAKTFYGAINSGVKKSMGEVPDGRLNELLGHLAIKCKEIIIEYAKRDWRDNVVVHRNIKKHLDDLLFDYIEENELSWSLDTIDIVIDEIMMAAKKVY